MLSLRDETVEGLGTYDCHADLGHVALMHERTDLRDIRDTIT